MEKNIELQESKDEKIAVLIAETIFAVYGESQEYKDVVAWLKEHIRTDILDEEERKFADAVDSYRKEIDDAYQRGFEEGRKTVMENGTDCPTNTATFSAPKIVDCRYKLKNGTCIMTGGECFASTESCKWQERENGMKILEKILIVVSGLKDRGYEIKYFDKDDYGRYRIDIKRHEDDFWQSEEYKKYEKILGDSLIEGTYGSDTYTLWIKTDEEQSQELEECALTYLNRHNHL